MEKYVRKGLTFGSAKCIARGLKRKRNELYICGFVSVD